MGQTATKVECLSFWKQKIGTYWRIMLRFYWIQKLTVNSVRAICKVSSIVLLKTLLLFLKYIFNRICIHSLHHCSGTYHIMAQVSYTFFIKISCLNHSDLIVQFVIFIWMLNTEKRLRCRKKLFVLSQGWALSWSRIMLAVTSHAYCLACRSFLSVSQWT